jgi:hypothetical protein
MENIQYTDVLVVGGGAAGVAAAVAASLSGLKVTLLERNAFLGGKATAAEVGTVCGLYKHNLTGKTEYAVKGFAKEFAEILQKNSGTVALYNNDGLHYLPYDTTVFKDTCTRMLSQNHVHVLLNSELCDVFINNKQIEAVTVAGNNSLTQINIKAVVDCSGDAAISRAAKLTTLKSETYQAAAQVFYIQNIAEENEPRLGMILMKALRKAIDENKLPTNADRLYIIPGSLKNNCAGLKAGIPLDVTDDPGNLEALRESAVGFIHELTRFLVSEVPVFRNASLLHIAPEVGTRVGARTTGKYILTADDVLNCRKFDDAIANGTWPIEEWAQHKRVNMRFLKPGDHYQVPARCLQSDHIENLFMAGRNISATDEAIASARVMGTCLQTGYAAGIMAAGILKQTPEPVVINSIQNQQL